ncbi:DUF2254 domain-containing protein [Erythrobacter sanguineus]|uniref:Uncharacterized membrane protein n=1 Tax=Erythrobacter sanguineus TaxID=198312 RepID=A0A1M7RXJ4_9SPHN|nr:DUF2254 domain-containing protein [Erythrobacter sanguineus]SHN50891.1 Uncharacterized membrane protein [Erythrobacter sanguineus]
MTAELRFLWARINANYWFYPALFAIIGMLLAITMIWIDVRGFAQPLVEADWFVAARPEGSLTILSVMAGSMIGVAATVFSITIAAVAYASGNYGPRLLTNFMEDRGNQFSLATLIGTFVYALMVMRAVRVAEETAGPAGAGFVPQASLVVAYLLMALCVAVLVYFLHHIPSSIRINIVLEGIGHRLLRTIRDIYPEEDSYCEPEPSRGGEPLHAWTEGYVQLIDFAELESTAREQDCVLSLRVRTGDFVHRGLALVDVEGVPPEAIESQIRKSFTFGPVRTPEQDPQFLIDELTEIALRALSPGINDPFTAINALHWLGAATSEIARRDLRRNVCKDKTKDCPVLPCADNFEHFARRGFGGIRSAAATSPIAAQVMLDVLENAATPINDRGRRWTLREQGRLLGDQARLVLDGPDLALVEERLSAFERFFAPLSEP